jgi:voltage-gated sodium channel
VLYFTYEIIARYRYEDTTLKHLVNAIKGAFNYYRTKQHSTELETISETFETWFWLIFDTVLVLASWIAFAKHFIRHPEIILILRMLRIFRIFRIFSISDYIKNIEKKIIAVIPTISIFLVLIFLLIYTYAILGMNLYEFHKFDTIDFSNLYQAMLNLFMLMTNGWSGVLTDLRSYHAINPIITDIYVISFFIFSVMITLNVFLAVMTSGIQDRINEEKEQKLKQKSTASKQPEGPLTLEEKIDRMNEQLKRLTEQLNQSKNP